MSPAYRNRLISNREQIHYAYANVHELSQAVADESEGLHLTRAANSLQDALRAIDRALSERTQVSPSEVNSTNDQPQ